MEVRINPGIVGEYRTYREMILSAPPEAVAQEGDSVRLTSRIDVALGRDGTYLSRKALAEGSMVGGDTERIVERYSYDSIFGVQETAWRVDTEYVGYTEGDRPIIEKTSTDRVHEAVLSHERVDASTGVVLDEWFIADYQQRVMDPVHACRPGGARND